MSKLKPFKISSDQLGSILCDMYDVLEKHVDISDDYDKFENDFILDLESLLEKYLGNTGHTNYN